jgi:TatD DNase family protein
MHAVGLDGPDDYTYDALNDSAELAQEKGSAFTRGAEAAVIQRLWAAAVTAILHWYTGPLSLAEEALAAVQYFSINPAKPRSEKGRKVVAAIPYRRAPTESDPPFAKSHGHPARPADMRTLVAESAKLWGTDRADAQQQLYDNLTELYATTVGKAPPD